MKILKTLTVPAAFLALSLPIYAQAGSPQGPYASHDVADNSAGAEEAHHMVPARGALLQTLDTRKDSTGQEFRVKLAGKVKLDNGPELPSGTILVGKIVADDMQIDGISKLALRLTQADLKNGTVVPIKATIVEFASPRSTGPDGNPAMAGNQIPNNWNDGTLQVEQIDATANVDLHSKIASANSGVFVSTKKDDVKLTVGSEFALAIAKSEAE